MTKRILSLALVLILVFGLAACGQSRPTDPPEAGGTAPALPITLPTEAPETEAAGYVRPAGADSVKTLLEKSLDYLHTGDYGKIADVHDQQAYLGYFIMEDLLRDRGLNLAQAREKAGLLFSDPETLQAQDPELAEAVMEELDAQDPEEALSEYMNNLREAFRTGAITQENPNYDKLSAMLTDWDKGADYIFEHYPEFLESSKANGVVLGLEGAMDAMRRFGRFELYHEDLTTRFTTLECEYRPENAYVDESGLCSYDMGYVADGNDAWSLDLLYYVEDEVYYLVGYEMVLGSMGG